MERSFKEEVEKLKLGKGATFRGEGILAVTKALLQSGVSYTTTPVHRCCISLTCCICRGAQGPRRSRLKGWWH